MECKELSDLEFNKSVTNVSVVGGREGLERPASTRFNFQIEKLVLCQLPTDYVVTVRHLRGLSWVSLISPWLGLAVYLKFARSEPCARPSHTHPPSLPPELVPGHRRSLAETEGSNRTTEREREREGERRTGLPDGKI